MSTFVTPSLQRCSRGGRAPGNPGTLAPIVVTMAIVSVEARPPTWSTPPPSHTARAAAGSRRFPPGTGHSNWSRTRTGPPTRCNVVKRRDRFGTACCRAGLMAAVPSRRLPSRRIRSRSGVGSVDRQPVPVDRSLAPLDLEFDAQLPGFAGGGLAFDLSLQRRLIGRFKRHFLGTRPERDRLPGLQVVGDPAQQRCYLAWSRRCSVSKRPSRACRPTAPG